MHSFLSSLGNTTDQDALCRLILNHARGLVTCEHSSLFLIDDQQNDFVVYFEEGSVVRTKLNCGVHGLVAASGNVINIADASQDSRFKADPNVHLGRSTVSLLCVPIKFETRTIAVLLLANKKARDGRILRFGEEDIRRLQVVPCSLALKQPSPTSHSVCPLSQLELSLSSGLSRTSGSVPISPVPA